MEKTLYQIKGFRDEQACYLFIDGREITPHDSQQIVNHSPDGFNWGYGGSGPAQTALAICLEVYPTTAEALRYYQIFKNLYVSGWQGDFVEVIDMDRVKDIIERVISHGQGV